MARDGFAACGPGRGRRHGGTGSGRAARHDTQHRRMYDYMLDGKDNFAVIARGREAHY